MIGVSLGLALERSDPAAILPHLARTQQAVVTGTANRVVLYALVQTPLSSFAFHWICLSISKAQSTALLDHTACNVLTSESNAHVPTVMLVTPNTRPFGSTVSVVNVRGPISAKQLSVPATLAAVHVPVEL